LGSTLLMISNGVMAAMDHTVALILPSLLERCQPHSDGYMGETMVIAAPVLAFTWYLTLIW
jgi:hypothetical protein